VSAKACGSTCSRMFSRPYNVTGRLWRKVGRLRKSAGFTMTELIVVVVMVGVLAVAIGMNYGPLASSANLRTAVDQVAGDLRFLQSCAMATYANGGTSRCPSRRVTFPAGTNTYNLDGQIKSLPSGVTINNGLTLTISFNSLGEYTNAADATITLNSRGATSSVVIRGISGDVEAY
jgi:prepilin-type N-terminal cleavage/methylation domain-containing protein